MKKGLAVKMVMLIVAMAAVFFGLLPGLVEAGRNRVLQAAPYTVSDAAQALHQRLQVVDLHADSLLWNRDLLKRGGRGQLDVPRMISGGVAVQGFTMVTKTPRDMNIESNSSESDNITLLAIAELWPLKAIGSLAERVLHQAHRLNKFAARSSGSLVVIRNKPQLDSYLRLRASNRAIAAGFLGVEGAHALEGDLNNIDRFFDAGVRMMAPTHFFDTEFGGSAHGLAKGGLTAKGREMINRMEAKGMLLDLAHASPQTFDEALALATRPVVVSHTGVKGTCNNTRNLSDAQLRAVAANGGVVGIGYWDTAICGGNADAIAKAIRHAVSVAGIEHVGLGSDFDGSVVTPFDVTGTALITQALLEQGMPEPDIAAVMGGNALRLLGDVLPPS